MTVERILRIGILCDSSGLQAWQLQCLEHVVRLPFATIVAVVVNTADGNSTKAPFSTRVLKVLQQGLLLWRLFERAVLARRSHAIRREPLPVFTEAIELRCAPMQVGRFRQSLDEQTIEVLKQLELDVLVRFGFGILTGEVLEVARHGLWSFHHGDPEHFRGAPPGFWEIHNRVPVTGVVLQRLTEALDGGVILRSGWFKTLHASYAKSLDRLLFGAATFLAQALTELHSGRLDGAVLPRLGRLYRYPTNRAMVVFCARTILAWFKEQLGSLFAHQQWTVGEVPIPIGDIIEASRRGITTLGPVRWIPEQAGKFLADPFPLPSRHHDDEDRILAEEFDWREGVGQIVELAIPRTTEASFSFEAQPAIRSECHLSYPYVFESGEALCCVPECSESNRVSLYQRMRGSERWERVATLLEGFPAVDPTIFQHDHRMWLFCTNEDAGPNEMLFAWYADELLGTWIAHPLNPVKVDARSARPAGPLFRHGDDLIRPAQDCSSNYGGGIALNRIIRLTPDEFREETFGTLRPDATERYKSGLHTICAAGERTIVDGARTTFVPAQMRRALLRKLRLAEVNHLG